MKDYDAFGEIFRDHQKLGKPVNYAIEREDGYQAIMGSSNYFQDSVDWNENELKILDYIRNPILDIGCGAGRHSLHLQMNGFDITALDNSPKAIEVCRRRGIDKTVVGSIFTLSQSDNKYSTFLLFGNNINLAGSYYGNIGFFQELRRLSNKDTRIIGTYRSPLPVEEQHHLNYHEINKIYGYPIGQIVIRVRYKNLSSQWIPFYLPTINEFEEILTKSGWKQVVNILDNGINYVVLEL